MMPQEVREKYLKAQESIEGARKLVTVVFADINGFTALSEKTDPEKMVEIMNKYFNRLGRAVYEFEGYIDKFMGDCIMALFGAPLSHENDSELAVRCALKMLQELDALNKETQLNLGMSIGINSGIVVAGGVGTDLKLDFTVMGDAVNLAQRLQSAAGRNQILVSKNIHKVCDKVFHFETLEPIQVKGKENKIEIYAVQGFKRRNFAERGIREGRAKFIGRDEELTQAQNLLDQFAQKQSVPHNHVLCITGDAGMGKSRFKLEMREYARSKQIQWYESRCFQLNQDTPYFPFIRIVQDILKMDPEKNIEAQPEALQLLQTLGLEPSCKQLIQSLLTYTKEIFSQDTTERKTATFTALKQLFALLSQREPTVIYIDDVHWMDPVSKDLLVSLISATSDSQIMFGCGHRTEFRFDSGRQNHFSQIELKPLSSERAVALAQYLLGLDEVPDALKKIVLNRSEGNPLYIEEIMKTLIDSGQITRAGDKWVVSQEIGSVDIPLSLRGLVAARIDKLDHTDKEVVQYAAVIGRQFTDVLLARASGIKEGLYDSLQFLRRKELIFEMSTNENEIEYVFNHVLTQEVAYESILVKKRIIMHQRVAQILEVMVQEGRLKSSDQLETLTHHYLQAGVDAKAAFYLHQSARKMAARFHHEGAVKNYLQAAALLEKSSNESNDLLRAEVYFDLSATYGQMRRTEDAKSFQKKNIEIGKKYRNAVLLCRAYKAMGNIMRSENNINESAHYLKIGLEGARHLKESHLIAECLNDLGTTLISGHELSEAEKVLLESYELSYRQNQPSVSISSALNLGVIYFMNRDFSAAMTRFKEGISQAEKSGDWVHTMQGQRNMGVLALQIEQYDEALPAFEASRRIAQSIGNELEQLNSQIFIAYLRMRSGAVAEGRKWMAEAIERSAAKGYWNFYCEGHYFAGKYYAEQGNVELAKVEFEAALQKSIELKVSALAEKYAEALRTLEKINKTSTAS